MIFDKLCIDKILNNDKTVTRRLYRANGHRPAVPGKIHKLKLILNILIKVIRCI